MTSFDKGSYVVVQVEDLARLSFKRQPLYVGIDDSKAVSTREGLEQGYCVVPSVQRFLLLFTFLKKNLQKKVGAVCNQCTASLAPACRLVLWPFISLPSQVYVEGLAWAKACS